MPTNPISAPSAAPIQCQGRDERGPTGTLTSCDVSWRILRPEHIAGDQTSRVPEDPLECNADGPLVVPREVVREPTPPTVREIQGIDCRKSVPCNDRRMGGIPADDDQVSAEIFYADGRISYVDREPHQAEE